MLNFSNLNDVEFEYLCKDIMSKKLNVELQRFTTGRDGGIDLTDSLTGKNIIIQVKYYRKTSFSVFFSSIKKELSKVKELNPKSYFICCSLEFTPQNKKQIYDIFSNYMDSEYNIISLIEINDFLDMEENQDILKKHYKLWVESTNVFQKVINNNIFIDCDYLLYDIKENKNLFVKTAAYNKAISCLEKNNVLMILGNPGSGKTITSKMIVLYYASMGYSVRYSTDGLDISGLKKSISRNPETKEIIFLDDCFGQAYFNMKETSENELIALIKYIKYNNNKILVMNSRITIYKEVQSNSDNIVKCLDFKDFRIYRIDMNNIKMIDKAKILYNHLYSKNLDQDYFNSIRKDKNYWHILKHVNYSPRIIEYVTNKSTLDSKNIKPENYFRFIINNLNNPKKIWENEYERRLKKEDRIFLTTLYSFSEVMVSKELLEKGFIYRISNESDIDESINVFNQSLQRLNESMIKLIDKNGQLYISVLNPSVNDFLRNYIQNNRLEKDKIIKNSISIEQYKRLMTEECYLIKIQELFESKEIFQLEFESENKKFDFVIEYIIKNHFFDLAYKKYLEKFINNYSNLHNLLSSNCNIGDLLLSLLDKEFLNFYGLKNDVLNIEFLSEILNKIDLNNISLAINKLYRIVDEEYWDLYDSDFITLINYKIEEYLGDLDLSSYDVDIDDVVERNVEIIYEISDKEKSKIIDELENEILQNAINDIENALMGLPEYIKKYIKPLDEFVPCIYIDENIIDDYIPTLNDEYDDFSKDENLQEIDFIFNR